MNYSIFNQVYSSSHTRNANKRILFLFLFIITDTPITPQLHQKRIRMMRSSTVVCRIPTELNSAGTAAMDMVTICSFVLTLFILTSLIFVGSLFVRCHTFVFKSLILFFDMPPHSYLMLARTLFVCLFVCLPLILYFASRLGLEVNPQGVYTLGPRIPSYGPTKGTPPPRTTLRANCD